MEDPIISGVVTDVSEAKVTVLGVPDRPGISAALFEPLAAANVNVDMIVQNTSTDGTHRHQLHDAEGRHGRRRDDRQPRRRRDRRRAASPTTPTSPRSSLVGAGMKTSARRRRQDVPHARRRGRQHRDDLDVDDPHLGRRRGRRPRTRRARAAHRVRARQRPGATRRRCPNASDAHRRRPVPSAIGDVWHNLPMARRPQLIPWKTAGRVTEQQATADEVVRETGWVFNNETGRQLDLAEFVAHRRQRDARVPRGVRPARDRRLTRARPGRDRLRASAA